MANDSAKPHLAAKERHHLTQDGAYSWRAYLESRHKDRHDGPVDVDTGGYELYVAHDVDAPDTYLSIRINRKGDIQIVKGLT